MAWTGQIKRSMYYRKRFPQFKAFIIISTLWLSRCWRAKRASVLQPALSPQPHKKRAPHRRRHFWFWDFEPCIAGVLVVVPLSCVSTTLPFLYTYVTSQVFYIASMSKAIHRTLEAKLAALDGTSSWHNDGGSNTRSDTVFCACITPWLTPALLLYSIINLV